MRNFKKFNPVRIAKYVKIFFQGSLYVTGIGRLEFSQGMLIMPTDAGIDVRVCVSKVNKEIKAFAA